MKIVVDIPDWLFADMTEYKNPDVLDKAILKGTPLSKIREEIRHWQYLDNVQREYPHSDKNFQYGVCKGADIMQDIIIKYIGDD